MATRLVYGTILDHEENPVIGQTVRFEPRGSTYDGVAAYIKQAVEGETDAQGFVSVALHANQRYKVIEPGGSTYYIVVPTGTGDLDLQALRAASNVTPNEIDNVTIALDARLATFGLDDLADVSADDPADGEVLMWSDALQAYVLGEVLADVDLSNYYTKAEVDALLEGIEVDLSDYYTITQSDAVYAPISHNHDTRYYTETESNLLFANKDSYTTHVQATNPHGTTFGSLVGVPSTFGGYGLPDLLALDNTWAGVQLLPNGTLANPSLAFSSDPDTGLYLAGTEIVGLGIGGNQYLRVDAQGNTYPKLYWWNREFIDTIDYGSSNEIRLGGGYDTMVIKSAFNIQRRLAGTNDIQVIASVNRTSTGTTANGYGSQLSFGLEASVSDGYPHPAGGITVAWEDATEATRKARMDFGVEPGAIGGLYPLLRLLYTVTANDTGIMLWDNNSLSLKRVSVGAADSGGSGYRVLRIPN